MLKVERFIHKKKKKKKTKFSIKIPLAALKNHKQINKIAKFI